jgi:hypothetical protein
MKYANRVPVSYPPNMGSSILLISPTLDDFVSNQPDNIRRAANHYRTSSSAPSDRTGGAARPPKSLRKSSENQLILSGSKSKQPDVFSLARTMDTTNIPILSPFSDFPAHRTKLPLRISPSNYAFVQSSCKDKKTESRAASAYAQPPAPQPTAATDPAHRPVPLASLQTPRLCAFAPLRESPKPPHRRGLDTALHRLSKRSKVTVFDRFSRFCNSLLARSARYTMIRSGDHPIQIDLQI